MALTDAAEKDLAALRRSLARAKTFSFFVVIADGRARAETRARLHAWSGKEGVPELVFFSDGEAGAEALEAFLADGGERLGGAVLLDGDTLVAKGTPVQALNVARDRLGERIAGPLVVILAPRREVEFARAAPDLFDVRSATYVVEAADGGLERMLELRSIVPERVALLRETLPDPAVLLAMEASADGAPAAGLADAWLRRALVSSRELRWDDAVESAAHVLRLASPMGYRSALNQALRVQAAAREFDGKLDEARDALERALAMAEGDHQRALTMGEIANLLHIRGQDDEALRIRKEEELPVYERFGDVRMRAVTMSNIADILLRRGDTDEALRIQTDEVLPAFDKLGSVEDRTVAMSRIASILQTRGQLDDALRIWKEILLVDEASGDIRKRALTTAQIAGNLRARGQVDEALRLLTEEVEPAFAMAHDHLQVSLTRAYIGLLLLVRARPGDHEMAMQLLRPVLGDPGVMRMPELAQLHVLFEKHEDSTT